MKWKDWKKVIDEKLKEEGYSDEADINYIDLFDGGGILFSKNNYDDAIGLY